jgi:putative integral membrane protein (TIGR02587 family)
MTASVGNRHFAVELGRAFAGALIFSIAMLMTMEMWWIGFYIAPARLALFTLAAVLLLVRLAHDWGFAESVSWRAAVIDAFVGYAVGLLTAAVVLPLLGVIEWGMAPEEIVGKLALQAIPGAIGALLARSQLGERDEEEEEQADGAASEPQRYGAELFTMIVGALFVAFNVAPTEEITLISYMMTPWHGIAAVLLALVILHVFVYEVDFRGEHKRPEGMGFWMLFLRFTVVGYALVLLTCWYLLWTFGRLDDTSVAAALMMVIVLGFPGTLGAAAARLLL